MRVLAVQALISATISEPALGTPKIVAVSTTDDPAAPRRAGVELAERLGASRIADNGVESAVSV